MQTGIGWCLSCLSKKPLPVCSAKLQAQPVQPAQGLCYLCLFRLWNRQSSKHQKRRPPRPVLISRHLCPHNRSHTSPHLQNAVRAQ
jgi:hypothetical protein